MSGFLVSSSAQEAVKQRDQSAVIVIRAPGRTQSSGMFLTLCGGNIARVGAARWLPTRRPRSPSEECREAHSTARGANGKRQEGRIAWMGTLSTLTYRLWAIGSTSGQPTGAA